MLTANTMRFGTDGFYFAKQALLVAKTPWDTAKQTSVEGFTISGTQPAGTDRRVIFKVDDVLYKFTNGELTIFSGNEDFDSVIADGNTVDELLAITDIPQWLGKKIYPIIALSAPIDARVMPTIKIALNVRSATDLYDKTVESAIYELPASNDGTPRIADIVANTTVTGNATCTVQVRIRVGETWTNYMSLNDVKNREANAVQFKTVYHVTTLDGTDSAKLDSINIKHNMGSTAVSGEDADLYSVVQNYGADLQTCQVIINHKQLRDSQIKCYVNFMPEPEHRERILLGVSDGTRKQFILGVDGVRDSGIDQNTLKIFADGVPLQNFGYNVEVSEVTIDAENGKAISASYDYNRGAEDWREMEQVGDSQSYLDGSFMSKFTYTLPDAETADMKISNVRIQLIRPSGRVENEMLGNATGMVQQFVLPHAAKQDTIDINGEFSYDEDTRVLTFVGTKGTAIKISYDYAGEQPTVNSFIAAWIAAALK